jgi:hypothetical protein
LNKLEHQNFRAVVIEFIDRTTWQNPYAVTLTLKQATNDNGTYTKLDAIKASETLRHFCKRLNRSLLGRTAERNGQHITRFAVYEGTTDVRPHYHLCLDRPANIMFERFVFEIEQAWRATHFGYDQIDIKPCSDLDGWIKYMTKRPTKTDYTTSIDWNNTQLGA